MRMKFSDRSDMIWLALVPGLLHFLSFDFNYFLISGFPSWSAWGWLGWSSGVAFVVARGVAVVVVGGGFGGRQGWLSSSSRGWLSSSLGGCWPPSQPPTKMLAELAQVPKKHQNQKKNLGFFGKGFLFSVVISPLKKSPPLF